MLEKIMFALKRNKIEFTTIILDNSILINFNQVSILIKGNNKRVRYYLLNQDGKYVNIDKQDLKELISFE